MRWPGLGFAIGRLAPISRPSLPLDRLPFSVLADIRAIAENASSPARSRRYSLLATASSGYDSACGAALAQEAGCEDVFTFKNARPSNQMIGRFRHVRRHRDDSGEQTAKTLGYKNIIVRNRWAYLDGSAHLPEAEGCASGSWSA